MNNGQWTINNGQLRMINYEFGITNYELWMIKRGMIQLRVKEDEGWRMKDEFF